MLKRTRERKVENLLLKAAHVIEEYGWVQRHGGNKELGFCVFGAIMEVGRDNRKYADEVLVGQAIVLIQNRVGGRSIPAWNDSPYTSKEDVLRVLYDLSGTPRPKYLQVDPNIR